MRSVWSRRTKIIIIEKPQKLWFKRKKHTMTQCAACGAGGQKLSVHPRCCWAVRNNCFQGVHNYYYYYYYYYQYYMHTLLSDGIKVHLCITHTLSLPLSLSLSLTTPKTGTEPGDRHDGIKVLHKLGLREQDIHTPGKTHNVFVLVRKKSLVHESSSKIRVSSTRHSHSR
jgi:hypothetical protein